MDGKLDTLQSDIHEIREALLGHAGDVTKPGLVVRLDRVEQALPENLKERLTKLEDKIANRDKFLWMLISVVVTLVATRAWELIK